MSLYIGGVDTVFVVVNYIHEIVKLIMLSYRRPFPSISINNQVIGDTGSVSLARIDLDYGPEFRGAICGQPNPVHLLFKQWQSIYWNVRADRNSNNCTYTYATCMYGESLSLERRERKRRHFRIIKAEWSMQQY